MLGVQPLGIIFKQLPACVGAGVVVLRALAAAGMNTDIGTGVDKGTLVGM